MPEPFPPAPGYQYRVVEAILLAVAFAVAHTQSPLYFSNQNQYFLHGLAEGGLGHLSHDWLANTIDPTPVFSKLVALGYRHLGDFVFQATYFVMLMGYFLSLRWLVGALPGMPDTRAFRLLWAAGFIAAHAAILRVASVSLTGVDYPWFLQSGVAGQYLLGPGLQPSAFGVFSVAGLAAFARGRPVVAGFLVALPCAFHATYLVPAALLLFGFILVTMKDTPNGGPASFHALLAASAVMAPVGAYTLFTFGPENGFTFAEAQRILAEIRIPHHCVIDRWFDTVTGLQIAWALLGILLLRRSPLFLVLLIAAGIGTALTLGQYETEDATLALMFPWRISVLLVPVATAVIVAKLAARVSQSVAALFGIGVVLVLVAGGIWVSLSGAGYRMNEAELPTLEYVRSNAGPQDVYLLPVTFPAVGGGRGSISTSFTPPPRPKPGSNLIPVDLIRFRLNTGTAIYVDFKSVPYRDAEVLEWLRRMRQCEDWYAGDWSAPGKLQDLRREGLTHVVAPTAKPLTAEYLEVVHADAAYIVYRLK